MQTIIKTAAKDTHESFSMLEKHFTEVIKSQSLHFDAQCESQVSTIQLHMEKEQAQRDNESTYRDTIHTEHELATDTRLADMECRASTEREKLGQDIMDKQEKNIVMVQEQISNFEHKAKETTNIIKDQVAHVAEGLTNIQSKLQDHVLQVIMELVKKQCGNPPQLVDKGLIQL